QPLFWLLIAILLLIIFVIDWQYYIIPDFAVWGIGLLALGYRLYLGINGAMRWQDVWSTLLVGFGLMAFFWSLHWLTKGKGMGFGDVKYALGMGWLLGWPRALIGVFAAFLLGAMVGLALIGLQKRKLKQRIPFGPFLVAGTVLAL